MQKITFIAVEDFIGTKYLAFLQVQNEKIQF